MFSRKELSNAIRMLSIDSIEKAKSGHPGMPMGMADIAEVLWRDFLKHDPKDPSWDDRDRFVLSNGHGSMLIYSLLHLTGYDLSIDELKNFRQLGSKTPGHPEINCSPGIEITTGPLGQGLANAIGMAIAERLLGATFNRPHYNIVDHYTWVFMGDGCLMEGISHEVSSLAGTLGLGKLIGFYDKNGISIDGATKNWFSDDVEQRFKSYNWHVISEIDGHDSIAIYNAIKEAKSIQDKPSLIICKTVIGYGSPNKSNSSVSHGAPLGDKEIELTRKSLQWKHAPFFIPQEMYKAWSGIEKGCRLNLKWKKIFKSYTKKYPDLASEYLRRINNEMPVDWDICSQYYLEQCRMSDQNIASRQASNNVLNAWGDKLPELIGGSADLAPSNLTKWKGSISIKNNKLGNYIHYGVREFGMTAIANGIAHHGGFIPYTATFLMFSEYAHNAVRMSALMNTKHILIYTHDSIGLGEDGPTHQPIEQLSSLRLIPNLNVWRPSNQIETAVAWKTALDRHKGPSALVLSRQNLYEITDINISINNIFKGAYILKDFGNHPKIILIATGSEVYIAYKSAQILSLKNHPVRVVSMPSTNVFDQQDRKYQEFVLPHSIRKRIAIEAGISDFWYKYVGIDGAVIGLDQFGESAPGEKLFVKFGFTVENIVNTAERMLVEINS